jgi:hypothetical protein
MSKSSKRVASVGSPSSNYDVTLELSKEGRETPMVGAMLSLENKMGEGSELALGTVTEVTTRNRWHQDDAFRGAVNDEGMLTGMSGDDGDIRTATIRLQAAWRKTEAGDPWKASGPNLRMSPATGTAVNLVDDTLVKELTAETEDLHYMGHLGGTKDVRLPFNIPDFSGPAGAQHFMIYGISGAGKSQMAALLLANQMRHEVQGFAAELGRDVRVHRISTDLRLAKDAPLLTELLKQTRLVAELGLKSESTQDLVWYEITKALRVREDWTKDLSTDLLRVLLEYLRSDETSGRIYVTPDNRKAFVDRVDGVLNDAGLFTDALNQFAPIHNLFQETNASGGIRHDLWRTISDVFERKSGEPAPLLILDMSSAAMPGMDEEVSEALLRSQEILEKDSVKAAILRNLFATLKRASEDKFRAGTNLNTMVMLDEAWRYAAPTNKGDDEQLIALSKDLAGYARDTRKFGIGWLYISQSTKSVNLDIWDQVTIRLFGYGLSGGDVEKIGEIVDDRNALRLYRTFGNPRATGVYPFMITGPVSPLAANSTPLILNAYTDFDAFREDNVRWIKAIRDKLGKPVLSGLPIAPKGSSAGPKPTVRKVSVPKDMRGAIVDTNKAIRENQKAVGVKNTEGFGDPLSQLENEGIDF